MKEKNRKDFFEKYHNIESNLLIGNIKRKPCKYTFLIPAFRNPNCLERAINSIYKQEKCPEFDVLVIDDSGELMQEMYAVIEKFAKVYDNIYYYLNEKNLGLFGNWNRCYEVARSEYCCFLNHDDELKPNYLQRVNEIMKTGKYEFLRVGNNIIHNSIITNSDNWIDRKYFNSRDYVQIPNWFYFLYRGGFPPSGSCIRRECVIEMGGYDEAYYPASDYEFDARLTSKYRGGDFMGTIM